MAEQIDLNEPLVGEGWILDHDVHGEVVLSDGMPDLRDPFDIYRVPDYDDPYAELEHDNWHWGQQEGQEVVGNINVQDPKLEWIFDKPAIATDKETR